MLLILHLGLEHFLPQLDIAEESGSDQICFFDLIMPVTNYSRFFPLLELVNHPLIASVKPLHIFSQHGQIILNYLGMLELGIKNYRHYRVHTLTYTRQQFPSQLHTVSHLMLPLLQLTNLLIVELVTDY